MLAALVYPHQLFDPHPALIGADLCVLVEEPLLFTQYAFHAQKLVLHRAAMSAFATRVARQGVRVERLEARALDSTSEVPARLLALGATHAQVVDPCDDWLARRLGAAARRGGLPLRVLGDPHFLTPPAVFDRFAGGRQRLFFTSFYVQQRKRLGLLLDEHGGPLGGKWSFDPENRKKLPRGVRPPEPTWPADSADVVEARRYVAQRFPAAPGGAEGFHYPTTPADARACLDNFLDERLAGFGDYEDAIDRDATYMFHSALTPALNCGLLSPREVVDAALRRQGRVPLNALEGFVRQVIGWREYIRGVYLRLGRGQRTTNHWGHTLPMPAALYDGTTGIEPVDTVVRRVLRHAYCHHIERLMILVNFMMLCEVCPHAVHRWFMELFIDAYDWVMTPNVYGMSQHADGGLITTKPYLSGSAYVLRMSNFQRGAWCGVWDALYWRFVDKHRDGFAANPRTSLMVKRCDALGAKLEDHRRTAGRFLDRLHAG